MTGNNIYFKFKLLILYSGFKNRPSNMQNIPFDPLLAPCTLHPALPAESSTGGGG